MSKRWLTVCPIETRSERPHGAAWLRPVPRFTLSVLAASILACVAAGISADAATLRVPQDYSTVRAAVNAASNGDTVAVAPGRYFAGVTVKDKDVAIIGTAGASETVLEAAGADAVTYFSGGGELAGFTITAGEGYSGRGVQIRGGAHAVRIHDCVFDATVVAPQQYGAAIWAFRSRATIDRNVFRNVVTGHDMTSYGGVIFVDNAPASIVNNVFEHNDTRAVNLIRALGEPVTIANNTMVDSWGGIYVGAGATGPLVAVRNNIIVGNARGLETDPNSSSITVFESNLLFGNGEDAYFVTNPSGTDGNISVAPGFVDPAAGDYHLLPTSPAIDQGTERSAASTDFDGRARPSDGDGDGVAVVDIGAFEAPGVGPAFDMTIQDDTTGDRLAFNSTSGAFRFTRCAPESVVLDGVGTVHVAGCKTKLTARGAMKVNATAQTCAATGKAKVTAKSANVHETLVDADTTVVDGDCP